MSQLLRLFSVQIQLCRLSNELLPRLIVFNLHFFMIARHPAGFFLYLRSSQAMVQTGFADKFLLSEIRYRRLDELKQNMDCIEQEQNALAEDWHMHKGYLLPMIATFLN